MIRRRARQPRARRLLRQIRRSCNELFLLAKNPFAWDAAEEEALYNRLHDALNRLCTRRLTPDLIPILVDELRELTEVTRYRRKKASMYLGFSVRRIQVRHLEPNRANWVQPEGEGELLDLLTPE